MSGKKAFLSVLIAILVSACTTPATATPPAPTVLSPTASPVPATRTPIPAAPTAAPTTGRSPTLMPAAPSSGSQTACQDSATLVADVTYPDNSTVAPGQAFTKTWRLRNNGTCAWDSNYTLVYSTGDRMNSPADVTLQPTAPGSTIDLSVDLVAPTAGGTYTGNYVLHNAAGSTVLIDSYQFMWVKVVVTAGGSLPAGAAGAATNTSTAVTGASGSCTYTENPDLVNQLYTLINAARAENSLPPLKVNSELAASARVHSIDMACHSLLSHTGSDGSTIQSRIAAQGYKYDYWNEAIYAQPPQYGGNAQSAVTWWLNDPPHRVILLTDQGTEFGAGYVDVVSSTLGGYYTIDFGSPKH